MKRCRQTFEEWYELKRAVFVNFDEMPESVDHFKDLQIGFKFGVYQRYFLQEYGWLIYVKPDYDKFSIHIEHGLDKEIIYQSWLINNNINSVQQILIEKAFEKIKDYEESNF